MPLTTLVALLALSPPPVAEFFPLVPGTRYTYTEGSIEMVHEVGKPTEVGGTPATPMLVFRDGKEVGRTYYRAVDGGVDVVARDPKQPFPSPHPVLRMAEGPHTWSFRGPHAAGKGGELLVLSGDSRLIGTRQVLGKQVEILRVRLIATLGEIIPVRAEQESLYARGIGLVQMTSRTLNGKKPGPPSTMRLLSYGPPAAGG